MEADDQEEGGENDEEMAHAEAQQANGTEAKASSSEDIFAR